MFGKKQSPKIVRSIDESFETIIGQSTEIHGQIIATQSLRIDGSVTGDIRVSQTGNVSLAIGLTGVVQGDIHAQRLIVGGRMSCMTAQTFTAISLTAKLVLSLVQKLMVAW